MKEFGARLAPGRQAIKAGNSELGIPLFVNGVGGAGAYERRSDADKKMNQDNFATYQADAITTRPRPIFTCRMAKAIVAPTLLLNGELSPRFFHKVNDELDACLPNHERAIVNGSSHTVPSERSESFNEAVLVFFSKY